MKLKFCIPAILVLFMSSCSTTRSSKSVNTTSTIPMNARVPTDTIDLRVLCAVGMRQVMLDLLPKFEQVTGYRVAISFNSSGEIVKWVDSGKPVDLLIIFRSAVEHLVATERVIVGSLTNVATSRVGVAVYKGAPKPDISSAEAFKKAMLDAKTIACPHPARGGASGTYITEMFERLGIAEALKSKLVLSSTPENENTMPGHLVATGKAEIALHQMQELLAVPGIEIVGPLPDEIQATFSFTAAITTNSSQANAAKALIQFLGTADAKDIIKIKGMKPAGQ
jgi:molybdate transport system substrate-binding protein